MSGYRCEQCQRVLNSRKELEVHKRYFHKQTDVCPECGNQIAMQEGCKMCSYCGWSKCG